MYMASSPELAAICPNEVNTFASAVKASGCFLINSSPLSLLREHTAAALNLRSWTAPLSAQSLILPVPAIPNRIISYLLSVANIVKFTLACLLLVGNYGSGGTLVSNLNSR